ncbi:MAG TPA: hypothetical protein VF427_09490 [Noviherbaspirillum sp.]
MTVPSLVPASDLLNIFYSDLFVINGKGTLFMGHGKSDCAWQACGKLKDNEIGQDFICLTRSGDHLLGHYQPYMVPPSYVGRPQSINVLVRCLSEKETNDIFKGDTPTMLFADFNGFMQASRFNICFTGEEVMPMMCRHVSPVLYADFVDPDKRGWRFHDLVSPVPDLKFMVMPWMPTAAERVTLLHQFV